MPDPDQRQTLLDLAAKAFAQHGYAGASVRTITDAARMNPAMVGYYFGSKEALFRAVLDDRNARIRERMAWAERGAESAGAARQRAYVHAVLEDFPELLHILFTHAVLSEKEFPAADCRAQLADDETMLRGREILERLAAECLFSPTPLMNRTKAERRALAESLAPKAAKKRRAPAERVKTVASPEADPEDARERYAKPSGSDDFLDGFVD